MSTIDESVARPARSRRRTLSRAEVLDAAVELIERDGVEALTMRKLAAAVDAAVMSLYNHVKNRDDVLDGVTAAFFDRVVLPAPTGKWEADMATFATCFREAALKYPRVAAIALTREVITESGQAVTAAALTILAGTGAPIAECVQLVRVFMSFVIGSILREVVDLETGVSRKPELRSTVLKGSDQPIIAQAGDELSRFDFGAEFDRGISLLRDGLKSQSAGRAQ